MPDNKELAGSAKNGVAKNYNVSCEDRNDPANSVISEFIAHIEVALAAVEFARAPEPPSSEMPTPSPAVGPIEQCHASISYICRNRAVSLNLYWSGIWPAARREADDTGEPRRQFEAVMIEFAGSAM